MKKVLSFVLVLALVLGSFSMAFAAELTDVKGDDNAEAINVVAGLGIITGYPDGTFQSANDVTRAEFAAMITRALAIPESALAGYTATSFNDVAGYTWAVPYLGFCETKGIMLGDGNGNAMPGRTINVNEAVTMVLRALGLTDNSAWLVGNWPANYVTVAKTEGLYKDVDATATVDRGSAAQLIYNALKCQTFRVNADGDTTRSANALIASFDVDTTTTAAVEYSDSLISKIALDEYYGIAAKLVKDTDDKIVAVIPTNDFYTGVIGGTGNTIKIDGVTYNVTNGTNTAINTVVNTEATGTAVTSALVDETVKVAGKISGKQITIDTIITWELTNHFVAGEKIQKDIADNKINTTYKFDTAANDSKKIIEGSYVVLGADLDKIAKDDVVYVYARTNNTIAKLEVGTKTVEGKVTATTVVNGTTNYAINGTNYVMAVTGGAVAPSLGDEGVFTLDYAGNIYKIGAVPAAPANYAVVLATDTAVAWGTTSYAIKLFTVEGQTIEANTTSTVALTTCAVKNAIVKYELNDKGEVKSIAPATTTSANGPVQASGKLINNVIVADNVIVLVDQAAKGWRLGKVSEFGTTVTATAITNSAAEIAVLFVAKTDLAPAATDDSYGFITKNDERVLGGTDGKTTIQKLDLIVDGAAKTGLNADGVIYTDVVTSAQALQKITIDANGVVKAVTAASLSSVGGSTATAVSGNIITINGSSYELAANVVVYAWNKDAKAWTVVTAADVKDMSNVTLYDAKTDSKNPGYEIVVAK